MRADTIIGYTTEDGEAYCTEHGYDRDASIVFAADLDNGAGDLTCAECGTHLGEED
jgi:hypothetical protein